MLKYNHLIVCFLAAVLIGCAAINLPMAQIDVAQSSAEFQARSLNTPQLKAFFAQNHQIWPQTMWQPSDLTLAALYYQPSLKIAQAQLAQTKGAAITAGQSPNPVVGITPSRDTSTSPLATLLGLNLSWPIETNGKKDLRLQQAQAAIEAATHRYNSLVWDTHTQVANALLAWQTAQHLEQAYSTIAQHQQQMLALYQAQKSAGQIFSVQARQASMAYQQSLLARQQAEKTALDAKASLATTLAVPLSALDSITIKKYNVSEISKIKLAPNVRKNALQNNTEIKAALADFAVAHKALEIEVAKQVPDIDLGPAYEWNSQQGGKFALGLNFTLPIMNNNEGPIAEAQAHLAIAAATFNQTQDKVLMGVDQAQTQWTHAQKTFNQSQNLQQVSQARLDDLKINLKNADMAKLPNAAAKVEQALLVLNELDAQNQMLQAAINLENALRLPLLAKNYAFLNTQLT